MNNLKFITVTLLLTFIGFTSCQDEDDKVNGENPEANAANSQTAQHLKRSSMHDGSFDDFLDGVSCSSILLPVTATVNGTEVNVVSESDYATVIDILSEYNNDDDEVVLHFPLSVKLSNYTEVSVSNQLEYNALILACNQAENAAEAAINCLDINFPITIFTYNLNFTQTGSVVIESEEQLYTFMNDFSNDEYFAVKYPITANMNSETVISIASDLDLQTRITECIAYEDEKQEAEENAKTVETILVNSLFKVQSFVQAGVEKANDYADYTIDFAGNLSCTAENTVNSAIENVQGTYEVTSQTDIYFNLAFSGNATFELLNNSWEVTSYSQTSISFKSTTNAAATLVLAQI
ncbi:hypothetical protein L3X39_10575 [Sabulilitoribacter multivorans]|uniref:Lipoprotein n=1 Tax=Flaviramulus multivorans TaxID=1304750 RepID=A0ABS9IKH9_9FLAO|nr:hypothetical protein [Flaviramulus multivorans]MCF7561080.1 hypothetical protein [Flaviramulus multivorans]